VSDLGLSALTEDQLVSLLREVLAEAATRKVAVHRAASEVVIEEKRKLEILEQEISSARATAKERAEAEFRASVAKQALEQASADTLSDAEKTAIYEKILTQMSSRFRIEAEEKEKINAEARAKAELAKEAMDAQRAKVERFHARKEKLEADAIEALAADPGEWSIHVWQKDTDRRVYLELNPGYRQSAKYVLYSVGDAQHKPGVIYRDQHQGGGVAANSPMDARLKIMLAADKCLPAGYKIGITVPKPAVTEAAHV
jgi:hypothetical protein